MTIDTNRALVATGEPCTLQACPPGLFMFNGSLGFKSEYGASIGKDVGLGKVEWTVTNWPDAYCADSGEFFWGGTSSHEDRAKLIVQPVEFAAPVPVEEAIPDSDAGCATCRWRFAHAPDCADGHLPWPQISVRSYSMPKDRAVEDVAGADVERLLEALEKAKRQFGFYAIQHRKKATADGDRKAEVNADFARMCAEALADFRSGGGK